MKHLERLPREISLEEKNEDGTGSGIVLQDALTPAIWAEKRERLRQVRAAVQELPVEFREAVVLCELEEMSYEEAAQMAGCPIGTIRSRLHRGRALLMAKLEIFRGVPRRASAARRRILRGAKGKKKEGGRIWRDGDGRRTRGNVLGCGEG